VLAANCFTFVDFDNDILPVRCWVLGEGEESKKRRLLENETVSVHQFEREFSGRAFPLQRLGTLESIWLWRTCFSVRVLVQILSEERQMISYQS